MSGKKFSAALSILSLAIISSSAFASHHAGYQQPMTESPGYKGMQNVINTDPRFEFTFEAIALKPGAGNLNYVIYNNELPAQSPTWYEQELKPAFGFAFELGGRYIFPQKRDINLEWTHMKSDTSSSVAAPSSSFFLGPDYEIGPNALVIRNAYGKVEFNYDVVNLTGGQAINFGAVGLHLFAGLSDSMLREYKTAIYSGTNTGVFAGPFSMNQQVRANFTGIGPRLGLDSSLDVGCGFSIFGEAAGSALIGSSDSKTSFIGASTEILRLFGQTQNNQLIMDQHVMQVIPGFDAKLGVNYTHGYNGMLFTVGAGYQAAVYINAINQYLPGSLLTSEGLETGGIFVATMSHTQSNYSVQGPYLNFKIAI